MLSEATFRGFWDRMRTSTGIKGLSAHDLRRGALTRAAIMELALSFLIVICTLAALKAGVTIPAKQQVAVSADAMDENASQVALPKAERLDANYIEDVPDKKFVRTTKIIPSEVTKTATPEPPQNITKIISRHWHERYAKMIRPSVRHGQ